MNKLDFAGEVIGLAMKVHRKLGPGFLESVYRNALMHELRKSRYDPTAEQPIKVYYDDVEVGYFLADIVVGDLILELKAVEKFAAIHEVQLVNYLNACRTDSGLLLNFGGESLTFKRKYRKRSGNEFR